METQTLDTPVKNDAVAVIEKSMVIFKDAGKILMSNQDRTEKALSVGRRILDDIQANGGVMTPELDERCNKYLANVNKAKGEMNDQRKPVTQIMDALKTMYTEIENQLDLKKAETIPAQVHKKRNDYAKQVIEEQQRRQEEADRKARIEKQRVELAAWIQNTISNKLIIFLSDKKMKITNAFNSITLDTYEEKAAKLQKLTTTFPTGDIAQIIAYEMPANYSLLDYTAKNTIRVQAHEAFDFKTFYAQYEREVSELKQQLIDRLPSKKQELDEAAEQQRLKEENDKKLLQAKNEEQRQQAIENQKKIEAEQQRQLEEKQKREKEEQERIQREAEEQQQKAEQKAESDRQAGTTMALFNQAAEVDSAPAPEVRQGFDLVVTHQAGFVEIFQFWFQNKGVKCSIDEIEKVTMKQMKTFCETEAHKNNHKIESKYLKYEPKVITVNRKAK